jgi:sirohydrochlorin cobaltochelatase
MTNSATQRLVVLMAHGSRDPRWRQPFDALMARLPQSPTTAVALCFMEMAEPTLEQVMADYPELTHLTVWPIFWAAGSHVATDIPEQVAALQRQRPHLVIDVLPPVGEHPAIQATLQQVITNALATHDVSLV